MYLTETAPARIQLSKSAFALKQHALFARLSKLSPRFELLPSDAASRAEAEAEIQAKFNVVYGAELAEFLQLLLAVHCPSGLSAVAGMSFAAQRPLFLEQYLDRKIEAELTDLFTKPVERSSIVEVGNLAANGNGASLALFIVLASALSKAGVEYMTFTATAELRKKFERLGFENHSIAQADPKRLAPQATRSASWGSYYDSDPQVVVGRVADAMKAITRRKLFRGLQSVFAKQIETLTQQLLSEKIKLQNLECETC